MRLIGLALALLLCFVPQVHAQDTPDAILNAAIREINELFPQAGRPQNWEHSVVFSRSTALECALALPGENLGYSVEVYRVTLMYPTTQYIVHVSADTQQIVVCDARVFAVGFEAQNTLPTNTPSTSASPTAAATASPTATIAWTPQITPSMGYQSRTCSSGLQGYLPSRLQAGQFALLESSLTLYSNFGRSSAPLLALPAGTLTFVLAGPECTEGALVWWQVEQQGRLGWLIESDALVQSYFLQPGIILPAILPPLATATPTLTPGSISNIATLSTSAPATTTPTAPIFNIRLRQLVRPTPLPASALMPQFNYTSQTCRAGFDGFLTPRLQVGAYAQVRPGDIPNNVRSSFSLTSQRIGEIPNGEIIQILAGPECSAEGFIWWQIDYRGLIGWTVESWREDDYYLLPYREAALIPFSAPAERITPANASRLSRLSELPNSFTDLVWGTDINDYVYLIGATQDSVLVYELVTDGAMGFAIQERLLLSETGTVSQIVAEADWAVYFNQIGPVDPWLIWLEEPQVNGLGSTLRIEDIVRLALSGQGILAISREDPASGPLAELWQLPASPVGEGAIYQRELLHTAPVEHMAFSPMGEILAAQSGNNLYLWEVNSGTIRTLRQLETRASDIAFLPGRTGQQMSLAYAVEHELIVWELSSGLESRISLSETQRINRFHFSPLGDLLVIAILPDAATPTLQQLLIFDTASGNLLHHIDHTGPDLLALTFDPSARILIAAGSGGATLYSIP